jgi:4-aminobutyrate--pyruvate transaminase
MQDQAQDEGLIVRAIGDTIAVCPPLIIVEDEIAELTGCLERALDATWTWVKASGLAAA